MVVPAQLIQIKMEIQIKKKYKTNSKYGRQVAIKHHLNLVLYIWILKSLHTELPFENEICNKYMLERFLCFSLRNTKIMATLLLVALATVRMFGAQWD